MTSAILGVAVLVLAVAPLGAQAVRTREHPAQVPASVWRPLLTDVDGTAQWDSSRSRPDGDEILVWTRVELNNALPMPDGAGGTYRRVELRERIDCGGPVIQLVEAWFLAEDGGTNLHFSGLSPKRELADDEEALRYRDLCRLVRPPVSDLVAELVRGTWAWRGECHDNPHWIRFSDDRRTMEIAATRPYDPADSTRDSSARYDILEISATHVRGAMIGETRRTPAGDLVIWDLVLLAAGRYHWRDTSWPAGGYTQAILRCT